MMADGPETSNVIPFAPYGNANSLMGRPSEEEKDSRMNPIKSTAPAGKQSLTAQQKKNRQQNHFSF